MKKIIFVFTLGLNSNIAQANWAKTEACEDASCNAGADSPIRKAPQKSLRTAEHEKMMQKIDTLMEKACYFGIVVGGIAGSIVGICVGCLATFAGFHWAHRRRYF